MVLRRWLSMAEGGYKWRYPWAIYLHRVHVYSVNAGRKETKRHGGYKHRRHYGLMKLFTFTHGIWLIGGVAFILDRPYTHSIIQCVLYLRSLKLKIRYPDISSFSVAIMNIAGIAQIILLSSLNVIPNLFESVTEAIQAIFCTSNQSAAITLAGIILCTSPWSHS
ncbi:hypothetical protein DFJ58DRAFT_449355 [Suillus subalutaceus]|uniref:uncharacterized protein n=1 Tax=Suillus subalutaceus TaxID=48586 RepID=UPI001B875470|nr:uncharacterized protein DFJ58DRAFT_449355 [Suillus subalutaceus]KAG1849647.1 hypothetical protein DFJ58DRAFT_449355 [Suillus subalutaceus]